MTSKSQSLFKGTGCEAKEDSKGSAKAAPSAATWRGQMRLISGVWGQYVEAQVSEAVSDAPEVCGIMWVAASFVGSQGGD